MTEVTAPDVRHVIGRIARGLMGRGGEGVENVIYRLSEQPLKDGDFKAAGGPPSKPVVKHLDGTLAAAPNAWTRNWLGRVEGDWHPPLHWEQSASYTDALLGARFFKTTMPGPN
jgi:hypothetical protein